MVVDPALTPIESVGVFLGSLGSVVDVLDAAAFSAFFRDYAIERMPDLL
jgi:hypothetical protein